MLNHALMTVVLVLFRQQITMIGAGPRYMFFMRAAWGGSSGVGCAFAQFHAAAPIYALLTNAEQSERHSSRMCMSAVALFQITS